MPWRLIVFIIIFAVSVVFISFNLGDNNKCDINYGFGQFSEVPVFITIFVSFFTGFLCALPLILQLRKKKNEPEKEKQVKAKKNELLNLPDGSNNAT